MIFSPVQFNEAAYSEYVDLFAKCFPANKKYSRDYLDWLYRCNPDGHVVGYDARDGDRLVAHYVCIPASAQVGGEVVKVLLSLNTATHPDYQGKGLFTQLAERTYETGATLGYDCVYGVANANSTHGFTNKLKFQLIGSLRAMVGIDSLGINFKDLSIVQFRRTWSLNSLAWRCASPINPISIQTKGDRTIFLAPALLGGSCMAVAEISSQDALVNSASVIKEASFVSPLRLFIGLIPKVAQSRVLYVDIPRALRPSPLNLIYRSLSGRVISIDSESIFFNFLDFDAY